MRGDVSMSSVERSLFGGKRDRFLWKACKLCPKGEVSMSTLNRKLNEFLKGDVQLRDIL